MAFTRDERVFIQMSGGQMSGFLDRFLDAVWKWSG